MRQSLAWIGILLLSVGGCKEGEPAPNGDGQGNGHGNGVAAGASSLKLTSTAFEAGAAIPRKYSGEGDDVSPPLAWSDAPQGTREYALICDDPDAPRKTWVHWVLYKLPAAKSALAAGEAGGGGEGKNDFGKTGYSGPMPPPGHGVHHYHFKLYALDAALRIEPGATKAELLKAMIGHILAEAKLIGTYERKSKKK